MGVSAEDLLSDLAAVQKFLQEEHRVTSGVYRVAESSSLGPDLQDCQGREFVT